MRIDWWNGAPVMKPKATFIILVAVSTLLAVLTFAARPVLAETDVCPDVVGFTIIGEVEHVTLHPSGLRMKARIDTGATTSSIGIHSKEAFERDGKQWIRFSIKDRDSDEIIHFEKPVTRIATIKRHGAESQLRPTVMLSMALGNVDMEAEFTLTDRSKFTFPVLIGRNVLREGFLVDVNRKFSTKMVEEREE